MKQEKASNLKKFRLRDNYIRFYLNYIEPHKEKINKGLFESESFVNLPGWEIIIGLQFENLVMNNLKGLCKILKIDLFDIVMAGPFFQRKTKRQKGCQIDLLIQTRHNSLYICEIKFSKKEINTSVIEEVERKKADLLIPKSYSIRKVLIHVNGVSPGVEEEGVFSHIVDFSDFLQI